MTAALSSRLLGLFAAALVITLSSGCGPRASEPVAASSSSASPAPSPAKPEKLLGPIFTLTDQLDRPLECVILAKAGSEILVRRTSDQQLYAIGFDRLSIASRRLLESYPDANTLELSSFVDKRDYAAAKRSVKVEMISATWCGYCTKAKNFFGAEGITYAAYDHESLPGKQRKAEWKTNSLPAVKIGDQIISGFDPESYSAAVLAAYRQNPGGASR